jgi:5'-AMP-activated protein kinase beta subunit, interaction domain
VPYADAPAPYLSAAGNPSAAIRVLRARVLGRPWSPMRRRGTPAYAPRACAQVQEYAPENLDSLDVFAQPPSPESSYGQPEAASEDFAKEPPATPAHLNLTLLNVPPALDAQAVLPRPLHVVLNHTYAQRESEARAALTLAAMVPLCFRRSHPVHRLAERRSCECETVSGAQTGCHDAPAALAPVERVRWRCPVRRSGSWSSLQDNISLWACRVHKRRWHSARPVGISPSTSPQCCTKQAAATGRRVLPQRHHRSAQCRSEWQVYRKDMCRHKQRPHMGLQLL